MILEELELDNTICPKRWGQGIIRQATKTGCGGGANVQELLRDHHGGGSVEVGGLQ